MVEKGNIIFGVPPMELIDCIRYIEGFKTERIAKELWEMGEGCLRKEKVWPSFLNFNKRLELEYYFSFGEVKDPSFEEYCRIKYEKKSFKEDNMEFNYLITVDRNPIKNELILLDRTRFTADLNGNDSRFSKYWLQKQIWQITVIEDKDIKPFLIDL